MPQDVKTIIRAGYAYNAIVWPGPTISAIAAAAALTQAAYDSGYIQLKNTNKLPFRGMALEINTAGPYSSTGASGSCTLIFTVTFSADGSTALGDSHVSQALNFTFAATVGTVTNLNATGLAAGLTNLLAYQKLPELRTPPSGTLYIRVQAATALTTVTGANYGVVGIALVGLPDSESSVDIT